MKIKIYKTLPFEADYENIANGIFFVNDDEYIVAVRIINFDADKFVDLEEHSKFHSENEICIADTNDRIFQLVFESQNDAQDFIDSVKKRMKGADYATIFSGSYATTNIR